MFFAAASKPVVDLSSNATAGRAVGTNSLTLSIPSTVRCSYFAADAGLFAACSMSCATEFGWDTYTE